MYCTKCGAENRDNMSFCKMCGVPLHKPNNVNLEKKIDQTSSSISEIPQPNVQEWDNGNSQQIYASKNQATYRAQASSEYTFPAEYIPISMWGYFGYLLLFSVPLVGFIVMIVFACGGTKNKHLQNFSRGYLCVYVLGIIITVFLIAITAGSIGGLAYYLS